MADNWAFLILFIVCFFILFGGLQASACLYAQYTPEYADGYSLGYSEYNVTKYNAAVTIVGNGDSYSEYGTLTSDGCFAYGYGRGYETHQLDDTNREKDYKTKSEYNKSLKLLNHTQ